MATTIGNMLGGLWLPSSALGPALGFTHLPHLYWPLLALTLLAYMVLTQAVKAWLHHRRWIRTTGFGTRWRFRGSIPA
jgi:Mg2+-importing ATPase